MYGFGVKMAMFAYIFKVQTLFLYVCVLVIAYETEDIEFDKLIVIS